MAKVQLEAVLKLVDVQINPQVFRKISQSVAGLPASLQQTTAGLKGAGNQATVLNNRLGRTGKALSDNERAAKLLLNRMAQFAILLPTFSTLNHAIQGSVKFLFEFDSILRDIVRTDVKGLTSRMEDIGDAALKTAVDLGTTAQEVLSTTKVFIQAGLSIEASQERARLAILATQVSTLDATDSVEFFLSAANQFGLSGDRLAASLDALVKVEDLAAVEAKDIAEAFRTGGNSMAEFGKDINDAIGLISALREQTRKSGREIGTFFKTLQTRIFAAGEARTALEQIGVTVENLDGTLRPTLDVLNDMKKAFEGLTEAQTANAAKAIGGVRQFESLIATLNSLDRANELSSEASKAVGAVDEKRLVTDQKLERQLGKLIAQGQAFAEAFGDAGFEDVLVDALKVATSLLKVFTSLVDTIDKMGGSLAPLLALGGVSLAKGIFGLGGAQGSGGGPKPGQASFIGPQQQTGRQIGVQGMKEFSLGLVNGTKYLSNYSLQVLTNTTLSQKQGLQANINSTTLQVHTNALKGNIAALGGLAKSAASQASAIAKSTTGLLALTVAATFLPKVFESIEDRINQINSGTVFGQDTGDAIKSAAALTGITGAGVSLAAQFAVLGPKAAGIAGIFGVLMESGSRLVAAWEENTKALEEEGKTQIRTGNLNSAGLILSGITNSRSEEDAADAFVASLTGAFKNASTGREMLAALQNAFDTTASSEAFRKLGLSGQDLNEAFTKDTVAISGLITRNSKLFTSYAEVAGTTDKFTELQKRLREGTISASDALMELTKVLGNAKLTFDKRGKREVSFDEFKEIEKVTELGKSIRTLGLELDLAKAGPDALADAMVRLENELLLVQREAKETGNNLREKLEVKLRGLNDFQFQNESGKMQNVSVKQFFDIINSGIQDLDPKKIEEYNKFLTNIGDIQRKNAEDIEEILKARITNEQDVQKAINELQQERSNRAKALFEAEAAAAQNAFAATQRFSAELQKFGDSVTKDVLEQFQNVSLGDVNNVLAGTSDLEAGVQDLIKNAFGGSVVKAQTELGAISSKTNAELFILASRLAAVDTKLADSSKASEFAALTAEKRAILLEIETVQQQAVITSTEAKIKVLEAEQQAAKEAAEAEKKRLDLLEKLADASHKFQKELRDIEKGFEDFSNNKIAELLGKEADAQASLKEAQQGVLASTQELAASYSQLVQAQLEFGGVMAEARIKSNLLARDIALLTGGVTTFNGQLSILNSSFKSVLNDSNITLAKRIELERQLADETLAFLQQARDSIVQAGIGVFGQSPQENQELGKGIAGLQFVADQLGGSFESFLNLTQGELSQVTDTLLNLPTEFRQQILSALSFLPSTTSIGGFSVDQLREAIGQVGAGVSPEEGLPSIEELTNKQVEQMQKLQELALQDAQLQYGQVIAAEQQVAKAQEAVDATKLLEQRASENLSAVRDAVIEEAAVLQLAADQNRELLNAVIAADDRNSLMMIEREAQLFADQNNQFATIGNQIVTGIASAINARLATIEAAQNVKDLGANFAGRIPNLAGGNLTPAEAAGLLRAGAREKRAMPGGAGLAVANTSEAIIPMNRGNIPNFQDGNISAISAGVAAIQNINTTVVAAIARSVTTALANVRDDSGAPTELLTEILAELKSLNDTNDQISTNVGTVASNTAADTGNTVTPAAAQGVTITLQTQQNSNISVSGLENLHAEIVAAVKESASEQVDEQLASLLAELDNIITALQERGLLTGFNQPR